MPIKNWNTLFDLPPIGTSTPEDHALFATRRDNLDQEAKQERDKWTPIRDACLNIFNYGDYDRIQTGVVPPKDDKYVINHAQGDMIGIKDVMFREPIHIEIAIEDDGSNVLAYYWNGPAQVMAPMMQQGVDPMTGAMVEQQAMQPVSTAQMYGIPPAQADPVTGEPIAQPIDEMHAQQLQQMGIPPHWLVAATNKVVSDVEQMAFDGGWRDCYADEWWDQFTMTAIKGGYNTGIYQFDEEGHHFLNLPTVNVFPDPTKQFVWDWEQNDTHWVLRLPVAQRKFPKYAALLAKESQTGNPRDVNSNTQQGYQYDRDFQTRTVTLSVTHLANQPIPMTPEEAVNAGQLTVEAPQPQIGGDAGFAPTQPPIAGDGPVGQGEVLQQPSGDDGAGAGVQSGIAPETDGQPPVQSGESIAPANAAQATAPVYISTATGMPVSEDSVEWPMRYVLRQYIMLGNILIEDEECPWPKMPIIHATCIPQEDTPYGFSPLWKMRFSQRSDSQMAEAISRNCKFIGNPVSYMSDALKQKMTNEFKSAFVEPDMSLGLMSDDYTPNGQPKVGFIEVPAMNEHHVEGRAQMQADRKELGGFTDALKGVAVTTDAPAALQRETMTAASGVVSSISKHLQGAIKHGAGLMLHSQLHYMSFDKIYKRCKRYNRDVLAALHFNHAVDASWKITASLASGAGTQRIQRRQELLELNQAKGAGGLPLCDDDSVQEAYNLDPETVRERNMQAMMATAPIQGQDPNNPEGGENPQNGQSKPNNGQSNGNGNNRFANQ